MNWNLDKFYNISPSNFYSEIVVDHNLEIPRPVVFCLKCFNCDNTKIVSTKQCRYEQRRSRSLHLNPMFIGTPCIIISLQLIRLIIFDFYSENQKTVEFSYQNFKKNKTISYKNFPAFLVFVYIQWEPENCGIGRRHYNNTFV